MKKIFYEKIGRKYVPVSEYNSDLTDALPRGTHIIMCHPNGRSTRYSIDPAFAPMIAAGRYAEDAISKVIMDASALRCSKDRKPLTPAQIEAWTALQKAFNDEMYPLEYCSYRDAAEAGVKAMQAEAENLLKHESVRRAYDHFMLMCELTKKAEKTE